MSIHVKLAEGYQNMDGKILAEALEKSALKLKEERNYKFLTGKKERYAGNPPKTETYKTDFLIKTKKGDMEDVKVFFTMSIKHNKKYNEFKIGSETKFLVYSHQAVKSVTREFYIGQEDFGVENIDKCFPEIKEDIEVFLKGMYGALDEKRRHPYEGVDGGEVEKREIDKEKTK